MSYSEEDYDLEGGESEDEDGEVEESIYSSSPYSEHPPSPDLDPEPCWKRARVFSIFNRAGA